MRKPRQRKEKGLPQVTQICRTEVFTLSTYVGVTLAIAQALGALGGSHITRPRNKPLLLVLLCLVGPGVGVVWQEEMEQDPHESPRIHP